MSSGAGARDGRICIMQSPGPTRTSGARRATALGSTALWLCDNTIWSGCVASGTDREHAATAFIREHNRLLAEDTRYVGSIVPIQNGGMTAVGIE